MADFVRRKMALAACAGIALAATVGTLQAQAAEAPTETASIAEQAPPSEPVAPAAPAESADEHLDTYRIGVGDVLQISVWKEPDHSVGGVVVRPDGKISLPLLREVEVVGLTPLQAEDLLTERFKEFINNPNVTVVVREIRSQLVFITGSVVRPGSIMMRPGLTVWQALAEAGGPLEYAKKKKIYVVREVGGVRTTINYDYNAVMAGEVDKDLVLKTGDTIVVPE